jgi:hypothetical protein
MTHPSDVARGGDIVARWCALAEQRLEYLTELFETGRWRRFHTERDFLENIQEAKTAVEVWRNLATRGGSRSNPAVHFFWLARPGASLPYEDARRVSRAAIPDRVASHEAPTAPDPEPPAMDQHVMNDVSQWVPDLDTIEERYPLLRNAL